ncbi:MAG: hypothetical protein ACJAUL_000061 [Paraglaciecola sp.]|jgi:hypothetical protein
MGNWGDAILFGFALVAFVLGISSIIMGFIAQPNQQDVMKTRVEYGFFGITSVVLFSLFLYALTVN